MMFKKSLIAFSVLAATTLSSVEGANASGLEGYAKRTAQQVGVGIQHAKYEAQRAYYSAARTAKRQYSSATRNIGSGGIVIIK